MNPYLGYLPQQQDPQIQRGANQMPYMTPMGGGLEGLGSIPLTLPTPSMTPQQQPSIGAALAGLGPLAGGMLGSHPPGAVTWGQQAQQPGNNLINQLVQKAYANPADPWNTQTIPAGSAHQWLNWAFNR